MDQTPIGSDISVLHEDEDILAVRKPSGMLSQPDHTGDSSLLDHCRYWLAVGRNRSRSGYLGLVHRLDRPVAGVMILAKRRKAAAELSRQIRNRTFRKRYLAVCHGRTPPNSYLTDHLKKLEEENRSLVVGTEEKGAKMAELTYRLVEYDSGRDLSLIDIQLLTGRHHQIRVQLSAHGHPLLGDVRYGAPAHPIEAPALFARAVRFTHPGSGRQLEIDADPDSSEPWTFFRDLRN